MKNIEEIGKAVIKGSFEGNELFWKSLEGALKISKVNFKYSCHPKSDEVYCDVILEFCPKLRKSEFLTLLATYNSNFIDRISSIEITNS